MLVGFFEQSDASIFVVNNVLDLPFAAQKRIDVSKRDGQNERKRIVNKRALNVRWRKTNEQLGSPVIINQLIDSAPYRDDSNNNNNGNKSKSTDSLPKNQQLHTRTRITHST